MPGPDAVLVDGYNVLHAIPKFAPRGGDLVSARDRFESWLGVAAARARVKRCVLVWDGRGGVREKRTGRLTVLYTAAGTSADDRLLALCRSEFAGQSATTWVVSSDSDVQDPARQLGFRVLGAMTFYRTWSSASGVGETGSDTARSSKAEIDELLNAFLGADRERG